MWAKRRRLPRTPNRVSQAIRALGGTATRSSSRPRASSFIDPLSYQYLDGTEIDYVESTHGSGFKFGNPNVTSTCGCGSSFKA
jgi:iron-sulfur cluster assembly accessory protein